MQYCLCNFNLEYFRKLLGQHVIELRITVPKQKRNLWRHQQVHYGKQRKFACSFPNCASTFTRKSDLRVHERVHKGVRPYTCTICGSQFVRSSDYRVRSYCLNDIIHACFLFFSCRLFEIRRNHIPRYCVS